VTTFPDENSRAQAVASANVTGQEATDFETAWNAQPRTNLGVPADGATVVVVKFNDYQCPTCRETHNWYKPILAKFEQSHPGAVKYVVKDWPWNSKCNFNVTTQMHPAACESSIAVRIAREMNKGPEMEDWIFSQNLQTLTPDQVKAGVEKVLGVTNFDAQYKQRLPDLQRDVADGGALQIRGTPTLFINGVRVDQIMPPAYFEMAINLELKKAAQ
jgi:protein-disulfide isomerase